MSLDDITNKENSESIMALELLEKGVPGAVAAEAALQRGLDRELYSESRVAVARQAYPTRRDEWIRNIPDPQNRQVSPNIDRVITCILAIPDTLSPHDEETLLPLIMDNSRRLETEIRNKCDYKLPDKPTDTIDKAIYDLFELEKGELPRLWQSFGFKPIHLRKAVGFITKIIESLDSIYKDTHSTLAVDASNAKSVAKHLEIIRGVYADISKTGMEIGVSTAPGQALMTLYISMTNKISPLVRNINTQYGLGQ